MFHSYDYISFFVTFFNIAVSLGNLFQGIASITSRMRKATPLLAQSMAVNHYWRLKAPMSV